MIATPKAWIRERKNEYYYKKAKEENYRSRSTYKLIQANEKYGFIKLRDVVVDLGAAPGGWIQAARKMTGKHGFVLGVDLKPIEPFTQEYIRTIIADLTEPDIAEQILSFLPRRPDVVISDAAPNITGVWEVDHARPNRLSQQIHGNRQVPPKTRRQLFCQSLPRRSTRRIHAKC